MDFLRRQTNAELHNDQTICYCVIINLRSMLQKCIKKPHLSVWSEVSERGVTGNEITAKFIANKMGSAKNDKKTLKFSSLNLKLTLEQRCDILAALCGYQRLAELGVHNAPRQTREDAHMLVARRMLV